MQSPFIPPAVSLLIGDVLNDLPIDLLNILIFRVDEETKKFEKSYSKEFTNHLKVLKIEGKLPNTWIKNETFLLDLLKQFPNEAGLLKDYAAFLKNIRKDYDKAEEYYKKAIKLDPKNADNIGNYAIFLENIRKDYDKAEEYYKKAIKLDPKNADNIGNYVAFLENIRKDHDKVLEAIEAAIYQFIANPKSS